MSEEVFCNLCRQKLQLLGPPFCPHCGEPQSKGQDSCPVCPGRPGPLNGIRAIAWYENKSPLTLALTSFKYRGNIASGQALAAFMAAHIDPQWPEGFDMMAPVPLHKKRLQRRGFNQAAMLAAPLKHPGFKPDLLRRVKNNTPQVDLTRSQRQENVKDIFCLNPRYSVQGLKILLVDDVWTTGSTMRECARVLKQAGAGQVSALTLCRAPLELEDS